MAIYKIQQKINPDQGCIVYGIQADTASEALFKGAKKLGFDVDFETQTYSLTHEAILQSIEKDTK
jgi:hypothetical protein